MSSQLQGFKDTYKRTDILLPKIERHVLRMAKERSLNSSRRDDVLHPSEMAKSSWCGRHNYYRMTGHPVDYKGRSPSFRMENVFDYGHSAHRKYQQWLQDMGVLWGKWLCKNCGHEFVSDTPESCEKCSGSKFIYKEVPLVDESLMIAGHSDGVVFIDGAYKMIEIKTVGVSTLRFEAFSLFDKYQSERLTVDELWFMIKRPFATHIRQGQIYLHLAKTAFPELNVDEIVFIYEWKPTQEVKEFVVKYNPELISNILETAEKVAESVRANEPPTRPEWAEQDGKTCSSCDYRTTCWGKISDGTQDTKPTIKVKRSTASKRSRVIRSKA